MSAKILRPKVRSGAYEVSRTNWRGWRRVEWSDATVQYFKEDNAPVFVENHYTPGGPRRQWVVVTRPLTPDGEPADIIAGPFPLLRQAMVAYQLEAARRNR